LLVLNGSPPERSISLPVFGWRKMNAQPPGPGLPLQAPSVKSCTAGKDSEGTRVASSLVWIADLECRLLSLIRQSAIRIPQFPTSHARALIFKRVQSIRQHLGDARCPRKNFQIFAELRIDLRRLF